MTTFVVLGQSSTDSSSILLWTLVAIFVTGVVTTLATKWARDKCLKLFHGYHVTLEGVRGNTDWGYFRCFSSGMELVYDRPYVDIGGRKKTSLLIYGNEIEPRTLSIFRYHDEQLPEHQRWREAQVRHTFNPGPFSPLRPGCVRNILNTLKDAFSASIGAVVGQMQKANPANAVLATQAGQMTQMGQTLLGRAAANAFEPLLEQYIGQPVILEVLDPINPNNLTQQYGGYLADYTQQFVAVFNVEHGWSKQVEITLPDIDQGDPLPPLAPPPPPGGAPPVLPPPLKIEEMMAIRIDGRRMRIQNTMHVPVVARSLSRPGFEKLVIDAVIPPNATLNLPAWDSRGARPIAIEIARQMDVIAPRKYATVRHAGELVERPSLLADISIERLPLIPTFLHPDGSQHTSDSPPEQRSR